MQRVYKTAYLKSLPCNWMNPMAFLFGFSTSS